MLEAIPAPPLRPPALTIGGRGYAGHGWMQKLMPLDVGQPPQASSLTAQALSTPQSASRAQVPVVGQNADAS